MEYIARIREVSTGIVRDTVHESEIVTKESMEYMWLDGNYSCDCNRELFFRRAAGEDPALDDVTCGDGRFVLVSLKIVR